VTPHRVTITFVTDENSDLNELVRLALALTGLVRGSLGVAYTVERSGELDALEEKEPF
jgi:hypothetical protein